MDATLFVIIFVCLFAVVFLPSAWYGLRRCLRLTGHGAREGVGAARWRSAAEEPGDRSPPPPLGLQPSSMTLNPLTAMAMAPESPREFNVYTTTSGLIIHSASKPFFSGGPDSGAAAQASSGRTPLPAPGEAGPARAPAMHPLPVLHPLPPLETFLARTSSLESPPPETNPLREQPDSAPTPPPFTPLQAIQGVTPLSVHSSGGASTASQPLGGGPGSSGRVGAVRAGPGSSRLSVSNPLYPLYPLDSPAEEPVLHGRSQHLARQPSPATSAGGRASAFIEQLQRAPAAVRGEAVDKFAAGPPCSLGAAQVGQLLEHVPAYKQVAVAARLKTWVVDEDSLDHIVLSRLSRDYQRDEWTSKHSPTVQRKQ